MLPLLAQYLIGGAIVSVTFFGVGVFLPSLILSVLMRSLLLSPGYIPQNLFGNLKIYSISEFGPFPTDKGFLFYVSFWIIFGLLMGFFLYKKRYAQSQKEGYAQFKPFDFDCVFKVVLYMTGLSVVLFVLNLIIKPFV